MLIHTRSVCACNLHCGAIICHGRRGRRGDRCLGLRMLQVHRVSSAQEHLVCCCISSRRVVVIVVCVHVCCHRYLRYTLTRQQNGRLREGSLDKITFLSALLCHHHQVVVVVVVVVAPEALIMTIASREHTSAQHSPHNR